MINAIMVNESNGYYEIQANAEPEPFGGYTDAGAVVVQAEPLTGWGPWTFAVQLDGGEFAGRWLFLDAAPGQDADDCPVCEGAGVMAPPCRDCAGDGWLGDAPNLARCETCNGTGGRPGPIPPCPVCQVTAS